MVISRRSRPGSFESQPVSEGAEVGAGVMVGADVGQGAGVGVVEAQANRSQANPIKPAP